MPEIGEVARIVHFLRKNLVGKTLAKVTASVDDIVYGKVGTSAPEIEKHLTGKKVVDVGQQGKYFWMIMSSPPHPVMHFGMSGWFKFRNEHTFYYRPKKDEEVEQWPPKFWKFHLETDGKEGEKIEAAFVDMRRLARVRLVDCPAKEIRKMSPLKENGPDPVIDKDLVTLEWLTEKCKKKKVPIKAMLLDQAVISGIGNWVGDEIMYNAKMHPEQYANTLQDSQIEQLHKSIHYICGTACELLADTENFPEDWLFKHRWGKGKKNATQMLPNGEKIIFLTVGGRTSAVVPSVQKKTGPVAKDISEAEDETDAVEKKVKKPKGKKRKVEEDESADEKTPESPKKAPRVKKAKEDIVKVKEEVAASKKTARGKKAKEPVVELKEEPETNGVVEKKPTKRSKKADPVAKEQTVTKVEPKETAKSKRAKTTTSSSSVKQETTERRRSGRNKA